MHIAESVVNRILNVADELEPLAQERISAPPPVTDPTRQSLALDQALATPTGPTPPIDQAPDPGATAQGKPLLATMLDPET